MSCIFIELFLLDNLLMDLLILRLAAAMLSLRPRALRLLLFSFAGAVTAAFALTLGGFMLSLPMKLITALFMSFALPGRGFRARALAFLALLPSAFTVGGAVLLAAMLTGGSFGFGVLEGGLPVRAALTGAVFSLFLPHIIRRVLLRRLPEGAIARLEAELPGEERVECAATVDTGNTLHDPLSGLPVIVLNKRKYPRAAGRATLPLPMRTAAGCGVIYALKPERVLVNGEEVHALIAFSHSGSALVPPCLVRAFNDKGGNYGRTSEKADSKAV